MQLDRYRAFHSISFFFRLCFVFLLSLMQALWMLPSFLLSVASRLTFFGDGPLFLPFFHLAVVPDHRIMGEDSSFNGNRTKGGLIDVGFHLLAPA